MAKKPKIIVGLACYEHKVYWQTCLSMFNLGFNMRALPFDVEFIVDANTPIIHARNNVAKHVLLNKEYIGALFIDSDMGFVPSHVMNLYEYMVKGFKIIGGNYTFKRISWPLVEKAVKEGIPTELLKYCCAESNIISLPVEEQTHPIIKESLHVGMGLTMIHRSVFETMVEQDLVSIVKKDGTEEDYYEFFAQGVTKLGYIGSEDVFFCRLAKQAGFKSYWHNEVRPMHIGTVAFEPLMPSDELANEIAKVE